MRICLFSQNTVLPIQVGLFSSDVRQNLTQHLGHPNGKVTIFHIWFFLAKLWVTYFKTPVETCVSQVVCSKMWRLLRFCVASTKVRMVFIIFDVLYLKKLMLKTHWPEVDFGSVPATCSHHGSLGIAWFFVFFGGENQRTKWIISWVVPPPSNSHHQDYYIFSRDPYKPSLATVTGRGDNPNHIPVTTNRTGFKRLWVVFWAQTNCEYPIWQICCNWVFENTTSRTATFCISGSSGCCAFLAETLEVEMLL